MQQQKLGPTATIVEYARGQPGCVISWSEAQHQYGLGQVISGRGPNAVFRPGRRNHKMSVSNVLRRHFVRVEGTQGLYVLRSSMENPDHEEDLMEQALFFMYYGRDEYGMSVTCSIRAAMDGVPLASGVQPGLRRMSEI